jgi:peptidoglycan/LPS O-acetylase OafA/YrhL
MRRAGVVAKRVDNCGVSLRVTESALPARMRTEQPTQRLMRSGDLSAWRLGPQPALQGVRAVAVMAAFTYHVGYLPGGWLGVEIFFVLSGFIITSILLQSARDGSFSSRNFYARRVARLLPASALVVAVVVLFSLVAQIHVKTHLLGAIATMTYWANVPPANGYGLVMLGHIWSLSIEEQFYILWPAVALVVMRWGGLRAVAWVAAIGFAASSTHRFILAAPGAIERVYYGTDTRAAGLLIGCLAAVLVMQYGAALLDKVTLSITVATLAVVAGALVFLPVYEVWTWRVGVTVVDILTAVAIVGLVDSRHRLTSVFARAPMVYIGNISYGIYLWHVPVITGAGLTMAPGPTRLVVQIVVPFMLAAASYRFVEEPIRARVRARRSTARAVSREV